MTQTVEDYLAERNAAFEAGDLEWARRMLPAGSSDTFVAIAFHKARYDCAAVSDAKRIESRDWLVSRLLTDVNGEIIDANLPGG